MTTRSSFVSEPPSKVKLLTDSELLAFQNRPPGAMYNNSPFGFENVMPCPA